MESGHGALVQATSGGVIGSGTTFLVDSTGTRYAVGRRATCTRRSPRWATTPRSRCRCPSPWLELFGDGPALTSQAATQASGSQS